MAARKVFSTPRLAEFAQRQGLTTRVGLDPERWPEAALKELIDNAIDDAETYGLPPFVWVTIEDLAIVVEDRGSGIDPDVVARIFDYDRQTSSREAYIEPTRGAQGNALQTILAMPYVLSGKKGELIIESRGVRHDLSFTIDAVTTQPVIEHERSPFEATEGTRVTIRWPDPLEDDRLKGLATRFAVFNPHLEITVNGDDAYAASDPGWKKRKPNRPPVARWYNGETLKRLMQAFAAEAEQNGAASPTIGAFVREFAGLTSTQKAAEVVGPLGLGRTTLSELLRSADCDAQVGLLLGAMKAGEA